MTAVARGWGVALVAVCVLAVAGCRQKTPLERGAEQYRKQLKQQMEEAELDTGLYGMVSDIQILRANSHHGLAIGLRPVKTDLRVGEPLRVELIYGNLSSPVPVSATSCQGFSMVVDDTQTAHSVTEALTFDCPKDDMLRDNNKPLETGQLRAAAINTADTNVRFDHPGSYLVTVLWQSYRPADDLFLSAVDAQPIESNPLLIKVR